MNAIDIVKEQAAAYDAGKSFAVVTIVQSDGSTPRSSGKMIVYPDGSSKGTVGGGAVEVVMTGKKELKALIIQPEVVDPEDIEMLQDLVISAVNEVIREIEDESTKEMEKISGGMSVPGLF